VWPCAFPSPLQTDLHQKLTCDFPYVVLPTLRNIACHCKARQSLHQE
jgi:hypothetical protein